MKEIITKSKLISFPGKKPSEQCVYYPVDAKKLTEKQERMIIVEQLDLVSKWECSDCESVILKVREKVKK